MKHVETHKDGGAATGGGLTVYSTQAVAACARRRQLPVSASARPLCNIREPLVNVGCRCLGSLTVIVAGRGHHRLLLVQPGGSSPFRLFFCGFWQPAQIPAGLRRPEC